MKIFLKAELCYKILNSKKVVNAGYFLDIINVLLCLVVAILTHDIFKKLHSAIKYIWLFGSKRVGFSDCGDGRWGGWASE